MSHNSQFQSHASVTTVASNESVLIRQGNEPVVAESSEASKIRMFSRDSSFVLINWERHVCGKRACCRTICNSTSVNRPVYIYVACDTSDRYSPADLQAHFYLGYSRDLRLYFDTVPDLSLVTFFMGSPRLAARGCASVSHSAECTNDSVAGANTLF